MGQKASHIPKDGYVATRVIGTENDLETSIEGVSLWSLLGA